MENYSDDPNFSFSSSSAQVQRNFPVQQFSITSLILWQERTSKTSYQNTGSRWNLKDCISLPDYTGISFKIAAIGMPRNPMMTLKYHCDKVRGVVFANVPRNSTIMIWKMIVEPRTETKTQFSSMPLKTLICSISRELISLKACRTK